MSTNLDLINDALGIIGVLPETTSASAEQASLCLRVLTEMLADWNEYGISVNYAPQAVVTDDSLLHPADVLAVKYNLAVLLCPYFTVQPPPVVVALAERHYARLLRLHTVRGIEPITASLPASERSTQFLDITSG